MANKEDVNPFYPYALHKNDIKIGMNFITLDIEKNNKFIYGRGTFLSKALGSSCDFTTGGIKYTDNDYEHPIHLPDLGIIKHKPGTLIPNSWTEIGWEHRFSVEISTEAIRQLVKWLKTETKTVKPKAERVKAIMGAFPEYFPGEETSFEDAIKKVCVEWGVTPIMPDERYLVIKS